MTSILRLPHPAYYTVLASGARTATTSSGAQTNDSGRGMYLWISVTALAATPSVVPSLEMTLDNGTTWLTVHAFTAITNVTGTGNYTYMIYPGILASADGSGTTESLNAPLPRVWRVTMTAGDTDSMTYSISAMLL